MLVVKDIPVLQTAIVTVEDDQQLIDLWLYGKSTNTRDAYRRDINYFLGTGRALTRAQINRIVATAAKQAGIDTAVSPHWLRHAHASHSLKRGADLNLVQKSLGHARLDTTSVYLHASPDDSSGLYLAI